MVNRYMDGDAAANLLERRWFAAFKAASGVRTECEALLESMALIEATWSRAPASSGTAVNPIAASLSANRHVGVAAWI